MYVAVKGGERAIDNAHAWLAEERRGDTDVAELSIAQIREQLSLAVNRVMAEGSLYDPDLAALAIKQARGDLIEAVFLIRAYRTTLPRFGASHPVDTGAMACDRRISATFKDLPGGQVLGPTFDYTHRLLDFALAAEGLDTPDPAEGEPVDAPMPHVTDFLAREDLIQPEPEGDTTPRDLTREPLDFPADRPLRLQALTRGDEGFVLSMAYSTQRGYGRNHPFVGELRIGTVPVEMDIPELGFAIETGRGRPHRMRNREPVHRLQDRAAAIHARLWAGVRPDGAQGDFHGAGGPRAALGGTGRGQCRRTRAGRGVRALSFRQCAGDGLSRAHQAAPLRGFPVRA
jgi:alpha-D-ribose 1-methylphosphonate 5-triphosphate synthase subunit PhnI